MELLCASECFAGGVAAYRLPRPLRCYVPWGFPTTSVSVLTIVRTEPLARLSSPPALPTRSRTGQPCASRRMRDSHRVCAPTAVKQRESTNLGLPHPVWSAFRVSHPLCGLRLPRPSALFHAETLMGFTLQRNDHRARLTLASRPAMPPLPLTAPGEPDRLDFEGLSTRSS
jgi:hypothetical protein